MEISSDKQIERLIATLTLDLHLRRKRLEKYAKSKERYESQKDH